MKPQCGTISCPLDWHYLILLYNALENNLTIKLKVEVLQLLSMLPRNSCTCAQTHKKNVYYRSNKHIFITANFYKSKYASTEKMCSQFGKQ